MSSTPADCCGGLLDMASEESADLIVSNRNEPASESVRRAIIPEPVEVRRDDSEHVLNDIGRIVFSNPSLANPTVNEWRVYLAQASGSRCLARSIRLTEVVVPAPEGCIC